MDSSELLIELENRNIRLTSELSGESKLYFLNMTLTEELGRPFEMALECMSQDKEIAMSRLLGKEMTVELDLAEEGETRYFHGFVTRFGYHGHLDGLYLYKATLRPWLWFLTRTADSRIFQKKTAVDIIKEIFEDRGFSDVGDELSGTYRQRDYCVQYRETDFAFVSRLMEEEGIYYYFKHERNKHTLVLSDGYSSHGNFPGYDSLKYFPPDRTFRRDEDHVWHWEVLGEVQPGLVVLDDFDFTKSTTDIEVRASLPPAEHPHGDYEVYDYPGLYRETSDGDAYGRVRMEELSAQRIRARSKGNARGLEVGYLYDLEELERDTDNREYLVVSATHKLKLIETTGPGQAEGAESGQGQAAQPNDAPGGRAMRPVGTEDSYACGFELIDANTVFRPLRTTPKPTVRGPQTAIVSGKSGEEIWTDEHGRVKVMFHWNREGNASDAPAEKKDENASCWIRVAQAWAGKNWGSMFIPRIGQEVIVDFLEGDPDRPIITGSVYNDQTKPPYELPAEATKSTLKSDSSKGGGGYNELRFEDKKDEEEVYFQAEKDFNEVIKNNHTLKIGFEKTDPGDQTIEIYNDRTTTIDQGNDTLTIQTGDRTTTIEQGNDTLTVSSGDQTTTVSAGTSTLEAGTKIELKVGSSSITIDPTSITLEATTITIKASASVEVSGSAGATVKAGAALTLQGAIIKIN